MRLLPKLVLGVLAASAVPLGVAGFSAARLSEAALRRRIETDHAALASTAADGVTRFFRGITSALRIYPQLVDLEGTKPEVKTGVLRLAYRASEPLVIVALLDDQGRPVVDPVRLTEPQAAQALGGRSLASDADVTAFLARVPVREALAQGDAVGQVVRVNAKPGNAGEPRSAVAIAFRGASGHFFVLAADVSLAHLDDDLGAMTQDGGEIALVDAHRQAVAGRTTLGPRLLPQDPRPEGPLPTAGTVATVAAPGQPSALAAFAPTGLTGYGVVVSQPEARAFQLVRDLRRRTLYWLMVSGALAALVGVSLARGLSRRISRIAKGTVELAKGRFDQRLPATSTDELGALARSFNQMAEDLGRASAEINAKNHEITRWNQELEQRVEAGTRDLRRAQDLLLRSQSLAAIGTLGAGIAHEINNPLTGVLGSAQLLLMDVPTTSPAHALLRDIEGQAQRIRKIVANLLRVTQSQSGAEAVPIDVHRVLEDALELVGPDELKRGRIEVERRYAPDLPILRGNPVHLQEAFMELLSNARRAMPDGGKLTLATATPDERLVSVRVADSGRGIDKESQRKIFDPFFTTKDEWSSTGMGLSLVHKIVEEHLGTITVDSEPGRGAVFTMTFPASAPARGRLD